MIIHDIPFTERDTKYRDVYRMWRMFFIERVMDLFTWRGDSIPPQHEIEQRLMLNGKCGFGEVDGTLYAFYCNLYQQTMYFDDWKYMNVWAPAYSKTLTLGSDGVCIFNNSTHTSVWKLIHLFSAMCAHATVTFIIASINMRETGFAVLKNQIQKTAYEQYRSAIINGKFDPFVDSSMLGVEMKNPEKYRVDITELYEVIQMIINDFYSAFGIRTVYRKKGNLISTEVSGDAPKLLINIKSMINQRRKGCEEIEKVFGYHWEVDIAEEITDFIPELGGIINETLGENVSSETIFGAEPE